MSGRGRGSSGGGRGDYSGGGRGRGDYSGGGRGRGGLSPAVASTSGPQSSSEGIANILHVTLTPNFKFYQYGVDISDKNGKLIDSSSQRSRLFYKYFMDPSQGYLAKVLKLSQDEIKDLSRTIFFQGSFFFAARPIPGLVQFPALVCGASASSSQGVGPADDGESVVILESFCFSASKELVPAASAAAAAAVVPPTGQEPVVQICMDRRCSQCTKAFTDLHALMAHCTETGHSPEYQSTTLNAQPATIPVLINYCNVALQHAMSERMLRWGRSYVEPNKGKELTDKNGRGLGVEIYRAYNCDFSVVKPHNAPMTLALTIDLRAKLIRKKSLLEYLYEDRDLRTPGVSLDMNRQNRFKQELIGEIVIATYDKKCYVVQDLLFDRSPATHMIAEKKISHEQYFKNARNIQLKYPNVAPMIAVEGRQKQTIYLPAELVAVNELDPMVKQKLPLVASFSAKDRMEAIDEIKRYFVPGAQRTRGVGGGLLPALGIQIQPNLIKIAVEILPLPAIIAANMQVPPDKGASWAPIMSRADYSVNPREAVVLNVLLVAHQSIGNPNVVYNRIRDFVNKMNATYRFPDSPGTIIKVGDKEKHFGAVEKHFSSKQPPNLFVVDLCRPVRGQSYDSAYSVVKHILSKGGYLSQFINFNTCNHETPPDFHKSDTILVNVARQVLSKCGFRVWWVNIPKEIPLPAVFIGVDVFHAPRKYDATLKQRVAKESVVAIVVQVIRSHDPKQNKKVEIYSKTFRRKSGLEMDVGPNLKTTVEEALRIIKVDPLSCIVWRDGVSDQMMRPVATDEIKNLRQAFAGSKVIGLATEKPPPPVALSYMVVQKRIATKLFTANGEALPCGALVTSLQGTDYATFYINGTAPKFSFPKPARYTIVQMDAQFGSRKKVLAELSWALCHDYSNWTGPIKLPAPTQFAHRLAELAGGFPDNGDAINAAAYVNKIYFI